MANPFLMGDLDAGGTQVSSAAASFNPFLSGGMDFAAPAIENPFMSTLNNAGANTNPFAFSTTDESVSSSPFFSSTVPDVSQPSAQSYDNIFSSPITSNATNGAANDFFGGFIETTQPPPVPPAPTYSSARSSVDHTPSLMDHNVNLFGDHTDVTSSREGSGANTPKGGPPRRPPPPPTVSHGPPPRPGLPPSKETKDLILSVTGTMEATSSHLLDRLQATRTPSPTPIRDLDSPSPTPDMFGDLLGVGDVQSQPAQPTQQVQEVNLLGDMDDDFAPTMALMQPGQIAPIAPVLHSVPPVMPVAPTAQVPHIPLAPIAQVPSIPPAPVAQAPPIPAAPLTQAPPVPVAPVAQVAHVPVAPIAQVAPMPTATPPPPRPVPPRPPERPKAPPSIPIVQENVIDFVAPAQPSIPLITETFAPQEEAQSPEEPLSARPSEPELDFSEVKVPTEDPTNSSSAFAATGFETNATSAFAPVSEPLAPSESEAAFPTPPEVTPEVHEDIFSNTSNAFADSNFGTAHTETAFPSSPFDNSNNGFDTSTINGFESDNNVTVKEISPVLTDNAAVDNSIFGGPTTQMNDPFFGNNESAFPPPAVDLFPPTETIINTTPVVSAQPFNIFGEPPAAVNKIADDFDAFAAKFESAGFDDNRNKTDAFGDAFSSSPFGGMQGGVDTSDGFGAEDNFDSFLATHEPPAVPQSTPAKFSRAGSADSDDNANDFSIFIKPKQEGEFGGDVGSGGFMPTLAPPPKSPVQAFQDSSPRFNPFDKSQEMPSQVTENIFAQPGMGMGMEGERPGMERTDSQETPPTPLFDEDVSQPLEDFPRLHYVGSGWEMQLRHPNKKKITGQRFWKKVFIRLVYQGENPVLQLLNNKDDKDPFQELPLQPCYSVSDIGAQQYDQYGKIFTVKLQFIFYKERPGVRPGQVTKAERITTKLSQFAAYAIQGDYQGVKEFGSDLKKLGLPVEHAPQISQLFKIGSQNFEDMKQFSVCIEEALFRLPAHRDRALNYKMEEVQITAVDELSVDQNAYGGIIKQIARVRLFFLGFLSGMPDVELGVNDLVRQGKEIVGRHDIIPVVTEEWIRLEAVEFASCIQQDEYERTRTIRFKPPDACYIELMRFRVRPPRNRELPLQLKATICITGNKVDLKADVLVPGFSSRKLGQIPCEDVMIRFPIPECWIYLFRVEKHFRYGSVKSAHRRTGKVKGLERFLGTVDNLEPQLMETTSGQAKYEHQHRAIVWRMPRLPKEGQGAYTTHNLTCHMALTSYDQIPENLEKYAYVEFTMPVTQVSHTTVRSVSICNSDSDQPPEKYVRQLARHEYRVEIEFTQGEGPGDYIAATARAPAPAPIVEEPAPKPPAAPDSDSDSSS